MRRRAVTQQAAEPTRGLSTTGGPRLEASAPNPAASANSVDDRCLYTRPTAMPSLYDMGDAPHLHDLRGDHGPQRQLLPLHELRFDQRV